MGFLPASVVHKSGGAQAAGANRRLSGARAEAHAARLIALAVAVAYFAGALFIFRGVVASIPLILDGQAVINGDELVPFFNPTSQLIDQAAGKFNQLTNGYEFRVRYSFLTTWMRYYKILPFAIVLVIPALAYAAYLAVSRFLSAVLTAFPKPTLYAAAAAPVALIFLILSYSKITHFYTLILGFSLFLIAAVLVTYGLIFASARPYRPIAAACLVTLLNPAVHYLILFALYLGLAVAGLALLEAIAFVRSGRLRQALSLGSWVRWLSPRELVRRWPQISTAPLTRCLGAVLLLGCLTLVPYGLFVKFVALRGVPNLAETVPGDFYFITDASIPFLHLISWDMAGIMDKLVGGDYLAKEPRLANVVYTVLLFLPLAVGPLRRQVFDTRPRRAFLFVSYFSVIFSMWATLGYSDPAWAPTFHRVLGFISRTAYDAQSPAGDLVVKLASTVVQVLRFPHRFQLILFMMACILLPIGLAWIGQHLAAWCRRCPPSLRIAAWLAIVTLFFVPLLSHRAYRQTFVSGDFRGFLAPYPVAPLQEVKNYLKRLPPGKVVVLPPTETAKVVVDMSGVEHKFIDKFHIYYLDLPSYYYGLTGDADNKFEFFLLLRALYYQQDWWVNIARDLGIRYIVVNKELIGSTVGGAEYLREIERIILPELDRLPDYVSKRYENDSYALYEFTDLPRAPRIPLLISTGWKSFVELLSSRLDLTRYYDLRHTVVSDDLSGYDSLAVIGGDASSVLLDLYAKAHPRQFAAPSSSIFAFEPDVMPSSYYLSPMFRLFQFFSDSKWNRLNMITPGLYGTLNGSFVGVPRATQIRIDARFPNDGRYRVLLRGAATVNRLAAQAKSLGYRAELALRASPDALAFYDQQTVFSAERESIDVDQYSVEELARLIPTDVVAVNDRYQYFDLGTVEARAGAHTFFLSKMDDNPLLVEGILVIPEEEYRSLRPPGKVRMLSGPDELCCGALIRDSSPPMRAAPRGEQAP